MIERKASAESARKSQDLADALVAGGRHSVHERDADEALAPHGHCFDSGAVLARTMTSEAIPVSGK